MRMEIWLILGLGILAGLYLANRPPHRKMDSGEWWLQRLDRSREDYLND